MVENKGNMSIGLTDGKGVPVEHEGKSAEHCTMTKRVDGSIQIYVYDRYGYLTTVVVEPGSVLEPVVTLRGIRLNCREI